MRRTSSERGFTLVEMIVSITLIGILAVVVVPMLQLPMASYRDAARRAETTADLDIAVGKLRTDLAQALPGSLRRQQVGNRRYLEFLTVRAQGRYRNGTTATATASCTAACSGTAKSNDQLEFGSCAESCFTSLGPLEPAGYTPVVGSDAVMVNALENNPYANGAMSPLSGFASPAPNSSDGARLTIPAKVMLAVKPSPIQRFYLVAPTPVSYVCDPDTGRLTRYWGYARQANQPTAFGAAVSNAPLAFTVDGCDFQLPAAVYAAGEPRRQVLNAWLRFTRLPMGSTGPREPVEALTEISVRED